VALGQTISSRQPLQRFQKYKLGSGTIGLRNTKCNENPLDIRDFYIGGVEISKDMQLFSYYPSLLSLKIAHCSIEPASREMELPRPLDQPIKARGGADA
jgi:hypothetical protein